MMSSFCIDKSFQMKLKCTSHTQHVFDYLTMFFPIQLTLLIVKLISRGRPKIIWTTKQKFIFSRLLHQHWIIFLIFLLDSKVFIALKFLKFLVSKKIIRMQLHCNFLKREKLPDAGMWFSILILKNKLFNTLLIFFKLHLFPLT